MPDCFATSQGEWTTTTSSRKSRKKGTSTEEQSKTNTGRTSSRSGVYEYMGYNNATHVNVFKLY